MPPSYLDAREIKDKYLNLTVNFYKALYAILYEFPYISSCKIDYDSSSILNNGISTSLVESCYSLTEHRPSNIKTFLKRTCYSILLALSGPDINYKFDNSIITLNNVL